MLFIVNQLYAIQYTKRYLNTSITRVYSAVHVSIYGSKSSTANKNPDEQQKTENQDMFSIADVRRKQISRLFPWSYQ